jgi:hypothetical protein
VDCRGAQLQEKKFIEALRRRSGVASEYAEGNLGTNSLTDKERQDARRLISQRKRKLIERAFGWSKLDRPLRQVKLRGLARVDWFYRLPTAAYNLVRMWRPIPDGIVRPLGTQCVWRPEKRHPDTKRREETAAKRAKTGENHPGWQNEVEMRFFSATCLAPALFAPATRNFARIILQETLQNEILSGCKSFGPDPSLQSTSFFVLGLAYTERFGVIY